MAYKKEKFNKRARELVDSRDDARVVYEEFDGGIKFIVVSNHSHYCAYVGLPKDHPLAGFIYDDFPSINAHGGLTYSGELSDITDGYYWYGCDYAHAGDYSYFEGINDDEAKITQDKDWRLGEVIEDCWEMRHDFKRLVKFAEEIINNKQNND